MSQNGTNDSKALKRLVVMFDGTGNTRQSLTNVSRMFEAIDDSHPKSYKCIGSDAEDRPPFQGPASTKLVQCGTCNQPMLEPAKHEGHDSKAYFRAGVPCGSCHQLVVEPALQPVQLVKYIPGVGTNKLPGWITALAFGYGLSAKIKEGYTWLCENYQEGNEVFVFGFSRGAFAARSLVSLLHKCHGVLKISPESEDHDKVIKKAYEHYKLNQEGVKCTDEKNEAEQRKNFITFLRANKITIEPLHVQVKMLGVWDTVGALGVQINSGIPFIDNCILSRKHYMFHEQGLSCIVDNAYHALALDEYREHFEPTLWTSRVSTEQEVKQVWFVGSHCNVGGGADLDDDDDPDDLWQYSYVWMQRHAEKHGLRFFWSYESPATRQVNSHFRTRRVSLRTVEPSYGKFLSKFYSKFFTPFFRITDPELAMLHWSVIARIKITDHEVDVQNQDLGGKKWTPYRPEALLGNHCSGHKIGGLFFKMFNFLYFGRTSEGVGSPGPKPTECLIPKPLVGILTHGIAEFMATVIPEGRTEVAPEQVDAKGTAPKWHIETDDVMTCTQWALEPREKNGKGKKKEAKKVE